MIEIVRNNNIFNGKDALNIKPGTIVKVCQSSRANSGDILLRIESTIYPFVNLVNGTLWENGIEFYLFEIISHPGAVIIKN